jgi:hypothetical protein
VLAPYAQKPGALIQLPTHARLKATLTPHGSTTCTKQGAEPGKSLSDRLDASRDTPPKMNFGSAVKALKEATGQGADKELSIRGASTRGNVVEVTGLVKGTTAEDVEVSIVITLGFLLFEEWEIIGRFPGKFAHCRDGNSHSS